MPHHCYARAPRAAGGRLRRAWPWLALGAVLAWPLPSPAQGRPADPLPEVLNAQAAVPPVQHFSALARYRRAGDTAVGSWRDANDTVTRIGGWRTYTREAHAPEPSPEARP